MTPLGASSSREASGLTSTERVSISQLFDDVEKMKAEFGPLFTLIYVASDDAGRVIGHFTLYNAVAWRFTLAESGGPPNTKIALISDPEEPSSVVKSCSREIRYPVRFVNTPNYSSAQATSRIADLVKYYYDLNRETPVHLIMDACYKTLGIAPDEPLSAKKAAELEMLVAYRLDHYKLGLPYVEAITPERLAEILRK